VIILDIFITIAILFFIFGGSYVVFCKDTTAIFIEIYGKFWGFWIWITVIICWIYFAYTGFGHIINLWSLK